MEDNAANAPEAAKTPEAATAFSTQPVRIAGATALVLIIAAGIGGYYLGYYKGQDDLRLGVAKAFASAFGGVTSGTPAPAPTGSARPPEHEWQVAQSNSPLDDSQTVTLSMSDSKPFTTSFGPKDATLIVRCKEHSTDVFIVLDEFLGSDSVKVSYRIDDQPAVEGSWSLSTDGKAVFAPAPVQMAKKLAVSHRFFARVSDFQGSTYDVEFSPDGLTKALPLVSNACHWPR
jgi:hypothetical protein